MADTNTSATDRKIGNVKWFNNKAGYGFITIDEKTGSPTDIFAHYSNINVSNSQYKYLVQGEYVEFILTPTPDGPHEFQATSITGIQGGPTLCERRRISRESADDADNQEDRPQPVRRQQRAPASSDERSRVQRRPPVKRDPPAKREPDADGFTQVRRKKPVSKA